MRIGSQSSCCAAMRARKAGACGAKHSHRYVPSQSSVAWCRTGWSSAKAVRRRRRARPLETESSCRSGKPRGAKSCGMAGGPWYRTSLPSASNGHWSGGGGATGAGLPPLVHAHAASIKLRHQCVGSAASMTASWTTSSKYCNTAVGWVVRVLGRLGVRCDRSASTGRAASTVCTPWFLHHRTTILVMRVSIRS